MARVQQSDAQVRIAGAPCCRRCRPASHPPRQPADPAQRHQAGHIRQRPSPPQLSAAYELDFWGRNAALRAAAVAQDFGSRYDRETVQLSMMAAVATTYFTALSLRDRVAGGHQQSGECARDPARPAARTARGHGDRPGCGAAAVPGGHRGCDPAGAARAAVAYPGGAGHPGRQHPDQLQLGQATLATGHAPPVIDRPAGAAAGAAPRCGLGRGATDRGQCQRARRARRVLSHHPADGQRRRAKAPRCPRCCCRAAAFSI